MMFSGIISADAVLYAFGITRIISAKKIKDGWNIKFIKIGSESGIPEFA